MHYPHIGPLTLTQQSRTAISDIKYTPLNACRISIAVLRFLGYPDD